MPRSLKFSGPKRLKYRAKLSATEDVWKGDINLLNTLSEAGMLPRRAAWMQNKLHEEDIDVARYERLETRASNPDKPWIDISRDLMVVDADYYPRVTVITELMDAEDARSVGTDLNTVYAGLVAAGEYVKRGDSNNLPRADGSVPKMVQVGQIASRNDPNTNLRAIGERDNPELRDLATATATFIVKKAKWQVQDSFQGLPDGQQACLFPLVANSCVSSANITRDYQSPLHKDRTDVYKREHPFMSGLAWFPDGDGPMPEGSRLLLPELKLRVKTSGGVLVFFDTKTMLHGTEAGEPCGAGEAARMGIALHCKSNLLAMATEDDAQIFTSLGDNYLERMRLNRIAKGQQIRDCDLGDAETCWPGLERDKTIPTRCAHIGHVSSDERSDTDSTISDS